MPGGRTHGRSFPPPSFPPSLCPHSTRWGPWLLELNLAPSPLSFPQWRGPAPKPGFSSEVLLSLGAVSLPRTGRSTPSHSGEQPCVWTLCPYGLDTRVSSLRPTGVSSCTARRNGGHLHLAAALGGGGRNPALHGDEALVWHRPCSHGREGESPRPRAPPPWPRLPCPVARHPPQGLLSEEKAPGSSLWGTCPVPASGLAVRRTRDGHSCLPISWVCREMS